MWSMSSRTLSSKCFAPTCLAQRKRLIARPAGSRLPRAIFRACLLNGDTKCQTGTRRRFKRFILFRTSCTLTIRLSFELAEKSWHRQPYNSPLQADPRRQRSQSRRGVGASVASGYRCALSPGRLSGLLLGRFTPCQTGGTEVAEEKSQRTRERLQPLQGCKGYIPAPPHVLNHPCPLE